MKNRPPTIFLVLAPLASALRVTVVGGTGFVGSRVCKALVGSDVAVTSLSKSGSVPQWAADEAWSKSVDWAAVDLLGDDAATIDGAMGAPDAVISCVGVVNPEPEILRSGNGVANQNAFASARRAAVKRVVYIGVASEVVACEENWLPFAREEFGAYFEGKRMAEEAAAAATGGDATRLCVLKPTFIYGGESFDLPLPGKFVAPRVSLAYGSAVEEILSLKPIQALADAAPGLIKVALRPPSSVDAVATACVKAALGELTTGAATRRAVGTLDGTEAINAAAGAQTPTVVREALARVGDKIADFTEKFFQAMQNRLDGVGK